MDELNKDYHYRQSVLPRLEKLMKLINDSHRDENESELTSQINKDYGFVHDLRYDLKETPHHRLTPLEMKECNELWKKYK